MALLEAQSAVQLDNANDIVAALEAYGRAVHLLSKVMEASSSPDEQERLRTIHDSYLFRIHLLSTPPSHAPATTATVDTTGTTGDSATGESGTTGTIGTVSEQSHSHVVAQIAPAQTHSASIPPPPHPHQPLPPPPQRPADAPPPAPTRRVKKSAPTPLPLHGGPILPPSEPRTPRHRSDSISAPDSGPEPPRVRHHTRSHTGGSTHRSVTSDLGSVTEQGQAHAAQQQRIPGVPKVRSRDHLGVPIHSAPTTPLPPTPVIPTGSVTGSGATSPSTSNPPTPNMTGSQTFMASLAANPPTSPPPRTPLPHVPSSLASPPASPAHATRRTMPSAPAPPPYPPPSSSASASISQQQAPPTTPMPLLPPMPAHPPPLPTQSSMSQPHLSGTPNTQAKSPLSPPAPIHSISNANVPESDDIHLIQTITSNFYEDDLISDEWLPDLSSSKGHLSFENQGDKLSDDPLPRNRVPSTASFSGSQLDQLASDTRTLSLSGTDAGETTMNPQPQFKQQQQQQHQRSFSQSSILSVHMQQPQQPSNNQASKSPLSGPMYSFHQGSGSMSSLHALDNSPSQAKRISDSARSIKEGSPLARTAATANAGASTNGSSTPTPTRPSLLHQHSSSKLSTTVSNTSMSTTASPTMDKSWSPNLNGGHTTQGGMTLFDVISDDPFGGMSFPLPPPFVDPPPTDTHLRCFWLMHKLEQTMMTGGFLTKRMFVPRAIWYQSLVRLPAADAKISALQTLTTLFSKFMTTSRAMHVNLMAEAGPEGDKDRTTIVKELDQMETAANQVQAKLSKKLSFIHRPGKSGSPLTVGTNQGYHEDMQGPPTNGGGGTPSIYGASSIYGSNSFDWSGQEEPPMPNQTTTTSMSPSGAEKKKGGGVSVGSAGTDASGGLKSQWKSFSKSVQKSMEAVIRLFQASYFLESMMRHYMTLTPFGSQLQILNKLRRLTDVLNQAICAFVVRDMGELMGKYVKRVSAWVSE
ncbi:hypothetical protein BGZ94_000426 [Podila epigama]|nr:hypothetical protein BGZ94_000426 [Podila epigama]